MKGPYERLKYDGRRVWECPVCHFRSRTDGDRTTALCKCQHNEKPESQIWMKLVEDGVRRVNLLAVGTAPQPTAEAEENP